ncbi:unnamed protein product [Clonostachys byssicola]|uniref:Uncharacterized protein n=1 Tax=Clonostachys byssicola TaxID=160290 RepID=A0A9N9U5T6_9HYPO|nr:unnamed protein product [Clonostachys byssicola]
MAKAREAPKLVLSHEIITDETEKSFMGGLLRRQKGPQWRAILRIWTPNTPRLMRKGFSWGVGDVNVARGYVQLNDNVTGRAWGLGRRFKHIRVYDLQPPGDRVEWIGHISVFAQEAATLAQFDLSCITPEMALKMVATNWQKRLVYLADRRRPDLNFNTIYGSMPLKGWWMWPKAEASISERTTTASGSDKALECPKNSPTTGPSGIAERYIVFVCGDRDSQAPKPYSKAVTKGEGDMEKTIEIGYAP